MTETHGLAKRLMKNLLLSALASILLLTGMQLAFSGALRWYFDQPDSQKKAADRQIVELQEFIAKNRLSTTDQHEITRWAKQHSYTLLELYRCGEMIYSSYVSKSYLNYGNGGQVQMPSVGWLPCYAITFEDGTVEAVLYYNGIDAYYGKGCDLLMILALASFPLFFLWGSRGIVQYVCQLSEEILAMEGGDLDHPITVKGSDELTTLAKCLDSMRLTLHSQQEEEAQSDAQVKNLITEMSHDLRTPLTTLLLYTEILRSHKYENDVQMQDYLVKIDTKARQIKQLSDNLFEYALITRDTEVSLDPPAKFSRIFEEPLAEMVDCLQQKGFACALELGSEDVTLTVRMQYIRRILDNITSNITKYADPAQDIQIEFLRQDGRVGMVFRNGIRHTPVTVESTKIGLTSIETMMRKMNGQCVIEQDAERFSIALLFPV